MDDRYHPATIHERSILKRRPDIPGGQKHNRDNALYGCAKTSAVIDVIFGSQWKPLRQQVPQRMNRSILVAILSGRQQRNYDVDSTFGQKESLPFAISFCPHGKKRSAANRSASQICGT
jgi:hypothetical protein